MAYPFTTNQAHIEGSRLTHHGHQLPGWVARLRTHTQPVLRSGAVQGYLFERARVDVLVVQVGRLLRERVVGANDLEGLSAAGRAAFENNQQLFPPSHHKHGVLSSWEMQADVDREDVGWLDDRGENTHRACATTML